MANLLLSKGRPQPRSMEHLLPLIPQSPPHLRLDMTKSIINAAGQDGIAVSVLNDALIRALGHPSDEVDQCLIPLVDILITAGASVDHLRERCFRMAAEVGSIKLLELLIHNMSEAASLSPAVPVCMKVKDSDQRQKFVGILLKSGAKGPEVNQALIDAIEEEPTDKILVQCLLEKADLEYLGGRALSAAMRRSRVELVASIINTGGTSPKNRLDAGQILFEPGTKERQAKLSLLLQAGVGQKGLDHGLIREISGEGDGRVVTMLLDHKASCEYDGGRSLELAICCQNDRILEQLIARRPNHQILENMIPKAIEIKNVISRRTCLGLLLRGGARGERVNNALVQEVETPDYRDPQLIHLLVEHGARIDYSDARAIKFAVSSPLEVDILRILASGTAASALLASLIPLAMKHRQELRLSLLQVLLEKGARGIHVDAALVTAVSEGAKAQPTVALLLEYKASVNYNKAEAIQVAALAGSSSILECLLSKNPDPKYLNEAIKLAMQSPSSPSKAKAPDRLRSVRLLTRSNTTKPGAVDLPLIQAVQEKDYELIEYLINSGADSNFRDGRSIVIATQQLNTNSLHILARSKIKPTPHTWSLAFSAMPQSRDRWRNEPEVIHEFDSILIMGGAAGPAVDQTFLSAVRSSHAFAAKFISVVLTRRTVLNVNLDGGKSLCIAVREARFEIVDYLLSQRPNEPTLRAAFMAIFESSAEERVLITLAHRFFEHSSKAKHIYFQPDEPANDALYQTLHRHGNKPRLLQTLLNNGCGSESQFSWKFNDFISAEQTSALLWLLCQGGEGIDSRTVNILLERGGK